MKYDVILAGVGGQGVLSVANIIAQTAISEGFEVRQSEVHGMAQRGGQVISHMRISDKPIAGDLIPKGGADMIIAMEPLEGLRYVSFLKPDGILVSSDESFVNMPVYPDKNVLLSFIKRLPKWHLIQTSSLAKEAGLAKAANTVMIGAASSFLPIKSESLEKTIADTFSKRDEAIVKANTKAFKLGQKAVSKSK